MTSEQEETKEGESAAVRDEIAAIVRDGKEMAKRITEVIQRAVAQGGGTLVGVPRLLASVVEGAFKGVAAVAPSDQRERLESVMAQLEEVFVSVLTSIHLTAKEAVARGDRVAGEEIRDFASELFSLAQLFGEIVTKYSGDFAAEARMQVADLRVHLTRIGMKIAPLVQALLQAAIEIPQGVAVQAAATTTSWVAGALRRAADKLDREKAAQPDEGTPS